MLTVTGLRAGYQSRIVLEILSLTLLPGTITAFIGPNGSGKSTLLRCLVGSLPLQEGTILWQGRSLRGLRAAELARLVAYVPQETPFPFAFTPRELVTMGAEVTGSAADGEKNYERIEAALSLFEMELMAHKSLMALSGGERQRASLARAFAQNSNCLLLDEPASHLDLRHQVRLANALRHAAHEEKKTVGVVLHDLNYAASFVDNVVLLAQGRVVASGASRETLTPKTISQVYQTEVRLWSDGETETQWFAPVYASNRIP